MSTLRVVKIGGSLIDDPGFGSALAAALQAANQPTIIVHGGGERVSKLQHRLGIETVKIGGMRRSDSPTLDLVMMVLCGSVSTQLVAALCAAGVDAIGLSGVDGNLLRCRKLEIAAGDLGFVGEIVSVRHELLHNLLAQGLTPVVAPISAGPQGQPYNVNADQAATAIAVAVGATTLDLVSNVPGVQNRGELLASLNADQARSLIASGEIRDGMLPKVQAALDALDHGVRGVRILNLSALQTGGGTTILHQSPSPLEEI